LRAATALLLFFILFFSANACHAQEVSGKSKILIAYFTWAENTIVTNSASVDVDASTSASMLPPGNTGKMAQWIQTETGGDLFSIVTVDPYSSNYNECLERSADEQRRGGRPRLKFHVDNMKDYDIVFLGYPIWHYTCPMAILSFLEEYDLSGKTVIPFSAHGTGEISGSVRDISGALPKSTVRQALGVTRRDMGTSQEAVKNWLRRLGIKKEKAE
jgi:flavodoxin